MPADKSQYPCGRSDRFANFCSGCSGAEASTIYPNPMNFSIEAGPQQLAAFKRGSHIAGSCSLSTVDDRGISVN